MGAKFISSEQSIAAAGAALVWQEEDEQMRVIRVTWATALTLMIKRYLGL